MKEPLFSILYLNVPEILKAIDRSTQTINRTDTASNILRFPHCWKHVVSNAGMKTCQRIATSGPMRKVGARPFETVFPGCEEFVGDEDSYFTCIARGGVVTMSHQVGTAKMGDPRDPTTVVDPLLRVKGIEGLRVVDASVMPIVPSGNTNIPTIMVAEKAADIIKETIQCSSCGFPHYDQYAESTEMNPYTNF
ncbi:Glucose dehydrogenase [FAD, quinone], partial [Araneus ventricosus]